MKRLFYIAVGLIWLMLVSTACKASRAPIAALTPEPRKGAIIGQVQNASGRWQEGPLYIYAAPYVGSEGGQGFYVLEPALHPSTELGTGGAFQLNNVQPGQYVLVVGPSPEEAIRVVDQQQKPRIFTVSADQVLDVGQIQLEP